MEEKKLSLVEHLEELRGRIIYGLLFWLVFSGILYYFSPKILKYLAQPLGRELIFTGLADAFLAYLKLSLLGGFFLALPFFLWQLYLFVRPGLKPEENRWVAILLLPAFLLFLAGAGFSWFFLFPAAIKFFLSYAQPGLLTPLISVKEYLGLAVMLALLVGIFFELPLVMLSLAFLGIFSSRKYKAFRKYAVLLAIIIAGVFSPTVDLFTQLLLSIPLILLYEFGIILSALFKR